MISTKRKIVISIFIALILVLALIVFIIPPFYLTNDIINGVFIDNINLSGLSKDEALKILNEHEEELLNETTIAVEIRSSTYDATLSDYDVHLSFDTTLNTALTSGNEGNLFARLLERANISNVKLFLSSDVMINEQSLNTIVTDYKIAHDSTVVEGSISFDPSEYDYFDETHDPSSMFTITEGNSGWALNYDASISILREALLKKDDASIVLPMKEIRPQYTQDELEKCTTLIYHSSSHISGGLSLIPERSQNIGKALEYFKGLVVMPGEIMSFYNVIGKPSIENGWYPPMDCFTPHDKSIDTIFSGIDQAATAVFNAAVIAGAEILERHTHLWPAYSNDYGYGMDAYLEYGKKNFVFKNTTDYPMFFDAYFWYAPDRQIPRYVDVDVYTMPLEDELHIRMVSVIEQQFPPPETKYIEAKNNEFSRYSWQIDEDLSKLVYVQKKPKDEYRVSVYKVWYKDCVETRLGVWEEGVEVRREEFDYVIYPSVQGIIYTKPIPEDYN